MALRLVDFDPSPSPTRADSLPGLTTELKTYYLGIHAAVVLLIAWYGQTRGRVLETAIAVQIVYTTVLYENMLLGAAGLPLLWGNVLVIATVWFARAGEEGLSGFRWSPIGLAVAALTGAALITGITGAYKYASLVVAAEVGAFALLAIIIANLARGERQIRLLGAALVLPGAAMGVTIIYKTLEIANNMGFDFAVRNRFFFVGLTGPNPLGLSLAIALILALGSLFWLQAVWERAIALVAAIVIIPGLLALYSPISLAAFAVGLTVIVVLVGARSLITEPGRVLTRGWVVAAALVVTAGVGAGAFIPNAYSDELRSEVTDPTAGRARSVFWPWSFSAFTHNPIVGNGLRTGQVSLDSRNDARTQYLPEFPFREVTKLAERRFLLGGDGNQWRPWVSNHPHNLLLNVAEGMGTLGLVTFGLLVVSLSAVGLNLLRRPMTRYRWIMTVALGGLAASFAWAMFALGTNVALLPMGTWVLLGLLGAGHRLAYPNSAAAGGGNASPAWAGKRGRLFVRRLRRLWIPVASLVVLLLLVGVVVRPALAIRATAAAFEHERLLETDAAIADYELAHWLDPLNAGHVKSLSQLHLERGEIQEGVKWAERQAELQTESSPVHVRLGWVYWLSGDLGAALREFERAVELDPWDALRASNHTALGLALTSAGRRAEAIESFKRGFLVAPSEVRDDAWLGRESIEIEPLLDPTYGAENGLSDRLVFLIQERLRLTSGGEIPPLAVRSDSPKLFLLDVLEDLYADYHQEQAVDPVRAVGMLYSLGRAYDDLRRPEKAIELYEELRELVPDESYVPYELAEAYQKAAFWTRAERLYEEAIALTAVSSSYDLREPFAHLRLGVLLLGRARVEEAQPHLQAALDTYRWPYLPGLYEALALAATRSGDTKGATEYLDRLGFLLGADEQISVPE